MRPLNIDLLNPLSSFSSSLDLVTIMTRNALYIPLKKSCAKNTSIGGLNKQAGSPNLNPKQVRKQSIIQLNLFGITLWCKLSTA